MQGLGALLTAALLAQSVPTDVPVMVPVDSGIATVNGQPTRLPPGWFVNEPGYKKLGEAVGKLQTDNAKLQAERDEAVSQANEVIRSSSPAWFVVVGAIGLGLAAGFTLATLGAH